MNNIKQKNVIYGMKSSGDLPYKQVEYINHNECCETLNEVDINNLANQLVDNDVYVEQYLNHTSSYVVGPKKYDETTIESMPNGYKAFGNLKGANYLQILHKVETPIGQTVTRLQTGEVKVLKKFGDLMIATIQGITKCAYDPVNGPWKPLLWYSNGQPQQVDANDVYTSDSGCFVAADNGIFQLSSASEYDESSEQSVEQYSLVKLDRDSSFPHATSIVVDEKSSKIYVGCNQTGTKMLVGDYKTDSGIENAGHVNLKPVRLYSDHQLVTDDQINDIEVLKDTSEVIAAGNHSLYSKNVQNYLQDEVVFPLDGASFTASLQYSNRIFFGTTVGLWYKTEDQSLAKVAGIGDAEILKLFQGNGNLYVVTRSKIYSILPNFTLREEPFSGHGDITSAEVVGPCIVVSTSTGLWSYDASLADSYNFKIKDSTAIPGIKDLKYSSGYLAMAGESALSVMALSASSSAKEFPIITNLEEFPIINIDGRDGNSGFLKFISILGHKLAVFQTKIQCLDYANASYTPPLSTIVGEDGNSQAAPTEILNAISLGAKDGVGYLAVATTGSMEFLGFTGTAFETRRSFTEIVGASNLACIDDLVVASTSSQSMLSSWRFVDYDFLNSDPWTTMATSSPFTNIKTCGLCAICQVGSDGLSAFSKTNVVDRIPDDSAISGYSSFSDACAVDWLSTQFLATGDGSSSAKAFILSSFVDDRDDGYMTEFLGPISIGNAKAKRIEVTQDPDNREIHYAYVLNNAGALFCYELAKQLDEENRLTGYQVDKKFETIEQYSDLQLVSKLSVDGVLLTRGNSTYTHFPSLGELSSIAGEGSKTYAVPAIDEDPDGIIHKLVYSIGPNVQISSLADGHVETTPLANLDGEVKKIQIGFNGLYAQHGQTVAMTYTSSGIERAHDMQFDNGDGTLSSATVTDFAVCGISKDHGGESQAERDLLIAAIGDQLHIVDLDGNAPKDFSISTATSVLDLGGETITSIGSMQIVNDDEDTSTSFIAVGTSNQIAVCKVYGVPGSSSSQPTQITVELAWRKDDLGFNVKKLVFDKHDNLVCLDTSQPATRAHVFPVKIIGSSIIVEDQSQRIDGVKDVFQEHREDSELAAAWLHTDDSLKALGEMRSVPVPAGFACTSVGASVNGMVVLGSSSGLYISERKMTSSAIKVDFTGSQELKSASYAGDLVFVCGSSGGLSCYPLSQPLETNLTCLNDSTLFARCHASEYDGMIDLEAWTEHEIYHQTYDSASDVDANSFGPETASKMFQDISIQYAMSKDDQLMMPALQSGDEDMLAINLFAYLAAINNASYSNYFVGTEDGIYYDRGYYGLAQYPPDSTTKVLKFIQRDVNDRQLAYITSGKDAIKLYPSGDQVLSGTNLDDAILDNGVWYCQSGTSLRYRPFGDGGEELAFPRYGAHDISCLGGITTVDGRRCYGTDYGVLTASFVKQQVVGEDASIKALYQNFSWSGKNFKTLNQDGQYGLIVVAKLSANGPATVFKTDIRQSGTSEELKFYAPEGDGDLSDPVDLDSIWCVNRDKVAGMFCQPSQRGEHECESWLNAVVGTKLSPYTSVAGDGINAVSRHTDGYYLLCSGKVVNFTNYGEVLVFERIQDSMALSGYSHLSKISESKLLMVESSGLATYSNGQVGVIKIKDGIDAIASYIVDGRTSYLHNDGTSILSSSNYKMWKPLLDLPSSAARSTMTDATCLNKRTYLFATTDGLYGTKYSFEMVNDVVPMSKDHALSVYDEVVSTSLSSQLGDTLSTHLSTDHQFSSMITQLNEDCATVQLDDITPGWQLVEVSSPGALELGVKNDIIAEMTFGTGMDGDVVAQISNFLNPSGDYALEEISAMTYITKRWMSGVTELFINVPTTRTYYLNNLYGASDCKTLPENVSSRKNLEDFGVEKLDQTGVLSDHYTFLQIGLASAEYSVDKLVDVQINGMSLPLKIYKEKPTTGAGKLQDNLYRSFIEPSVGKGYNIKTADSEGNWIFNFACFGTDAQAVHLMFYDQKARSGGATVKVIFDPNGGDGVMSPQKFILKDDDSGYLIPEQKPLKKCKFTNTSAGYEKIFAGWSVQQLADNDTPTYEDGQTFPMSTNWIDLANELEVEVADVLKHKDEIKLYAVWLTYQFSENDTTLVFNSNTSEFAIDSVGVDESTNLKDKVVIDWGD